jgi:hypothetical protein
MNLITKLANRVFGGEMKKSFSLLFVVLFLFAGKISGQESAPLKLVQIYKLPSDVKGNFDHFAIDLSGNACSPRPKNTKRCWCSTSSLEN